MRILIINAYYSEFLRWFYAQHPGLEEVSYDEQMCVHDESLSGMADFYPSNLSKLGLEAWNVWVNDEIMQKTWAKEHDLRPERSWEWHFRLRRGFVPWLTVVHNQRWLYSILAAQINYYKPDVLLNMETGFISTTFLREVKGDRLLIGWGNPGILTYAYYLVPYGPVSPQDWSVYDLMLAPQQGMVDYFNDRGITAELLRHAFEPRCLKFLNPESQKTVAVSFIGLLRGGNYNKRRELLETLCSRMGNNIFIWASNLDGLSPVSSIRKRHQGHAWGRDLYRISANSKIALNCHSEQEGQFSGNKRLFDVTGLSTLLVTDLTKDLHQLFDLDKEVVAYRNANECVEVLKYYLEHDDEREAIARAGQQRTLREHTYYHRMQELIDITRKYR
jgi:spore maturation protein CgeB